MQRMSWLACLFALLILGGTRGVFAESADDEKTTYKGHICDADEYNRLVANKNRSLQIEGGYDKGGKGANPVVNVGDTVNMSLHIGVIGTATPYKLNTK